MDPTSNQPNLPPFVPPAGPAAPIGAQGPLRVVIEPSGSRWGRYGRRLLWVALGISVLANISFLGAYQSYFQPAGTIEEKFHSLNGRAQDKVAILAVDGVIMKGETSFAKRQIDRIVEDPHVKAVVLRIDSPGGTISGSDYLYHHLQELTAKKKLPLVVSLGSLAASGGYYVAMAAGDQAKIIYAEPTTWTGSIGVIVPHYDLTGLLDKIDVKDDSIASHPLKQMLSPTRAASPELRDQERKLVQQLVDEGFGRFKQLVLDSRAELRKNPAWQEQVFTGRIFTAAQAKQFGLVDEIGFIDSAIDRAIELARLDRADVRVVQYSRPFGLTNLFLSESQSSRVDLASLLDLTVPRAYYLCSWLPGLPTGGAK